MTRWQPFTSSDQVAKLAAAIRATLGGPWSHGGWKHGPLSFEHRLVCKDYPWAEEYERETMRVAVWSLRKATAADHQMLEVYLRRRWEGKLYNIRQMLAMGSAALWARAGVERRVPMSVLGVCTEVLYDGIDWWGREYQEHLRTTWERADAFDPLKAFACFTSAPELYARER